MSFVAGVIRFSASSNESLSIVTRHFLSVGISFLQSGYGYSISTEYNLKEELFTDIDLLLNEIFTSPSTEPSIDDSTATAFFVIVNPPFLPSAKGTFFSLKIAIF
jgi:hypothetical protein